MTSLNRTPKAELIKTAKKLGISPDGTNDELREAIRKAQGKTAKVASKAAVKPKANSKKPIWVDTKGVSAAHKARKKKGK